MAAAGGQPSYRCSLDWAIYDGNQLYYNNFGLAEVSSLENLSLAGIPEGVTVAAKRTPIFPRLDMEEEIAYIKEQMKWATNQLSKRMESCDEFNPNSTRMKLLRRLWQGWDP